MRKNHGIYLIFFTMWDFFYYGRIYFLIMIGFSLPHGTIYSMVRFHPWDFSGILNEKSHHSPIEL